MKQLINLGTGPNSGVGDTLYSGSVKINENFNELYDTIGNAVTLDHIHSGTGIEVVITPGVATINNEAPNIQSDWDSTSGLSAILNKPVLSLIATTGSYNNLLDVPVMPTLSAVALSGEYGDLLNAPVFPTLATVAVSGEYADLINVPQHDRIESGVFSAVLDGDIGELRIPDSLRFTLTNSDAFIYGPGAGHAMTISSGNGDIYNANGGNINISSGTSVAQAGDGGNLSVAAGNGANVGGNVNITGGRGEPLTTGDYPGRGGSVNITAGYGETYGGNVVLTAGVARPPGGSGPSLTYAGEVIVRAGNTAQWRYAFDGSSHEPHVIKQATSIQCLTGTVTETYASVYAYAPVLKLLVMATGLVTGDSTGEHTDAMEVMIVSRTVGVPTIQVFNRVRTSSGPLVNVTAAIDSTSNLVKVYCEPTDATNPVHVTVLGTEPTAVLDGQVIV